MVEERSSSLILVDQFMRLAPPILFALFLLFLIHGATEVLLYWLKAPGQTMTWLVQAELLVVCLFSAAIVPYSGRRGILPCGRVTAVLLVLVWVHLLYVCLVLKNPGHMHFGRFLGGSAIQYGFMLCTTACGVVIWSLVRNEHLVERDFRKEELASQFSLLSLIVWSTLVGVLLFLATNHGAFQVFADPYASFSLVVPAIICPLVLFVFVFPITRWLCRVKIYWPNACGVWIVTFAVILFGFCLFSRGESYEFGDGKLILAIQIGAAIALYLAFLRLLMWVLPIRNVTKSEAAKTTSWRYRGFAVVASGLWAYLILWSVSHFAVFTSNRDPVRFETSPFLLEQLESSFGKKAMDEVRQTKSETMSDWLNRLGRLRAPKETDLIYQLSLISRTRFKERNTFYLRQVGLTQSEIDAIPDHTAGAWLKFPLLMFAPWTRKELPLAARYCEEKEPVLERVLSTIERCDSAFFPVSEEGFGADETGFTFARDLLFAQTWLAIGEKRLQDALRYMSAQERMSRLIAQHPSALSDLHADYRIRGVIADQIHWIAMFEKLPAEKWRPFRELAVRLSKPRQIRSGIEGADFVRFALMQRAYGEDRNRYFPTILQQVTAVCPRSVNWDAYLKELHSRFVVRKRIRNVTDGMTRNFASAVVENDKLNSSEPHFGIQLQQVISLPSGYGRILATNDEQNALVHNSMLETAHACRQKLRMLKIGIERFEKTKGRLPVSLNEVEWLPDVTVDPFTGKPFIYKVLGENGYDIWSCSYNQIDDGGRDGLDLFLDGPTGRFSNPPDTFEEYLERQ